GGVGLRVGFVEGEAVVSAGRAVYDPQGWRGPRDFAENGSTAGELALVLNEAELEAMGGAGQVDDAARDLIRSGRATSVIVKRGFRGAVVVDSALRLHYVPAFRSERVFKIGTGDVFSASFAHHWGVERRAPEAAARAASLSVAQYASFGSFDVAPSSSEPPEVGGRPLGQVVVIGATDAIGSRYVLEEAVFRLRELGVDALASSPSLDAKNAAATLILADGMTAQAVAESLDAACSGSPVVVLRESATAAALPMGAALDVTDDFTTALYRVAWAASGPEA
ncbi:PfkB family carbohydrate kinase, partial [Sphingomonas sanguinis]